MQAEPPTTGAKVLVQREELRQHAARQERNTAKVQVEHTLAQALGKAGQLRADSLGSHLVQVSNRASANLVMDTGTGARDWFADGVLGFYSSSGEIAMIQGWNWYAGGDPSKIRSDQYDFQTVVTHELGHALGLGHSSDPNSVMNADLSTGVVRRTMIGRDPAHPPRPEGSGFQEAESSPASEVVVGTLAALVSVGSRIQGSLAWSLPSTDLRAKPSLGPGVSGILDPQRMSVVIGMLFSGTAEESGDALVRFQSVAEPASDLWLDALDRDPWLDGRPGEPALNGTNNKQR
jgi:hypothetical protein